MKKLHTFSYRERAFAAMYKELLEQDGIKCVLKNDQISAALGDIPFIECAPEIWLIDAEVFPKASILLKNWMADNTEREGWVCSNCSEKLEGQFSSCWSCGTERD